MFTKAFRALRVAHWVAPLALAAAATANAEETIDAFARAHLKASQAAIQGDPATANAQDDARPRPEVPPELLYIYGVENATVAHLRVDGRYGRNVTKGDKVGEWQIVAIGDDFVDVRRGARRQRLLLPSALGAAPVPVQTTDERSYGNAR